MADLRWRDQPRPLTCRVCGFSGTGRLILELDALGQIDLPVIDCPSCGSLAILDHPLDSSPTDASIDGYIESGAGINTIAEALGYVDPRSVRSFLDVGCNYGFALDLGRFLYGWEVVGVEPSLAGRRGAAELGLDIRNEYLTGDSQLGRTFDLILASEVLEHLPDPLDFLVTLRGVLTPHGRIVLTTPAAEIVTSDNAESDVLSALSPGYHVFLATKNSLEELLALAGFASVRIERIHGSLRAVAAVEPEEKLEAGVRFPITAIDLERYLAFRARKAGRASALATGMSIRYLRSLVARGDFAATSKAVKTVTTAIKSRYGIDLSKPGRALTRVAPEELPAWGLVGASFAMGMTELLHRQNPRRASEYFEFCMTTAGIWRRLVEVSDLDTLDLEFQAAYHRVLALVRYDVTAAESDALRLIETPFAVRREMVEARLCRAYVEIASRRSTAPFDRLSREVSAVAPQIAGSATGDNRVAALDALYCLGSAHLEHGNSVEAQILLELCVRLCQQPNDRPEHSIQLLGLCHDKLAQALTQELQIPVAQNTVHAMVDVYWCDAWGMYLEGWAHLGERPVLGMTVTIGTNTVEVQLADRPDLNSFYPSIPAGSRNGFTVYIPGRPGSTVVLSLDTAGGLINHIISLPDHPLPVVPAFPASELTDRVIVAALSRAPAGPVLAIGQRARSERTAEYRRSIFGDREVISLDIHPGLGVDVVGDAHQLSVLFPVGHFAVIYSSSLLEHITAPWLFALECAKVLKPGGFAVHVAPWIWPTHAAPNDFWRFSPEGLAELFSESLGFRINESGGVSGASVVPGPDWRVGHESMPLAISGAMSWVSAERTDVDVSVLSWPYDPTDGKRRAEQYPVDGLALEEDEQR